MEKKTSELKEQEEGVMEVLNSESSKIVNSGSGAVNQKKRKIAEADASMTLSPPVFDNRFTRMKLRKDVLIRTDKGFLEFFNLNSHLTSKCWEDQESKEKSKKE